MNENIKIEDKPIYCSAWVSKISKKVMCNTIPCCGFQMVGDLHKNRPNLDTDKIGSHPLVDGKFQFKDGTFHDPNFVREYVLVTETEYLYEGKTYKFSNQNLKAGDEVYPISRGFVGDDKKYHHERFDFRDFMCGFPDEPHIMLNLKHSDYKPYEARTDHGCSPIESYYKIIK
jgi:hypothetical protein